MKTSNSGKLRLLGLGLSALPLLPWPMFLIAGVMAPPGGWEGQGLFGVFVYFTMLYPVAFLAAWWLSRRSAAYALISALPFAAFIALAFVSDAFDVLF